MFSSLNKNLPPINRTDLVTMKLLPSGDWLGITNSKSILLGDESKVSFHLAGLESALIALGASSSDQINYLIEQSGKKINNMKATVSYQKDEIKIKYEVDSPQNIKDDIDHISYIIQNSLCPISNTLAAKTKITMKGKVY